MHKQICPCVWLAGTETLYLYGNSDESWELRPLKLLKPPGQPDPRMLGVKLVRGDMKHPKWLRHIAMHCDAWLIRISFLGANLGTQARQRLCAMINSLQLFMKKLLLVTHIAAYIIERK